MKVQQRIQAHAQGQCNHGCYGVRVQLPVVAEQETEQGKLFLKLNFLPRATYPNIFSLLLFTFFGFYYFKSYLIHKKINLIHTKRLFKSHILTKFLTIFFIK